MSFDAFEKALKGYNNPQLKNQIQKPLLTIVDYTMPSRQRRMFVLDMQSGKVMHNTWTAHGSGNGNVPENQISSYADNTSVAFSNDNGTLLASEGFFVTEAASQGGDYGPNVILNGVDKFNTKAKARAIVLHGDKVGSKQNGNSYGGMTVYPQAQSMLAEQMSYIKQDGIGPLTGNALINASISPSG